MGAATKTARDSGVHVAKDTGFDIALTRLDLGAGVQARGNWDSLAKHSGKSRSRKSTAVRRRRRGAAGRSGSARVAAWPGSLRGTETVVVVDEETPRRGVLVRLLQRLGYRVLVAASGMEARRLTGPEKTVDLVLAEFSALGTSGVELVRWFSANRPETKVLVAADWLWEVESCLGDLPRVGVLANQFTPTELARMVRAILK